MNREKGFTLIEVLLALAIIGVISAIFFSIFLSGNRFLHEGEARIRLQRELSFVGTVFSRELKNMNYLLLTDETSEENDDLFQGYIKLLEEENKVAIRFSDGRERNYGEKITEINFQIEPTEEGQVETLYFEIKAEEERNERLFELNSDILLNNVPLFTGENEKGNVLYYNRPS